MITKFSLSLILLRRFLKSKTILFLSNMLSATAITAETYTFDYEHRLKSIQQSAFSGQYFYDGKGNRLKAVRNGVTTKYVYDAGGNLIAEADSSNNIIEFYIYGGGSLLAMVTPADQTYSYHFNAIGSTVAMTDQNQNVVNKYAYDSFGNVIKKLNSSLSRFSLSVSMVSW